MYGKIFARVFLVENVLEDIFTSSRTELLLITFNIVTCLTEGRRYYATHSSLLGNRNNSMDTLTTPVFLRCMVTNSGKAIVSIVAGTVLKKEDNTQS
jgi:hypothetical protein